MGKDTGYDIEPGQSWEVDLFSPEDAEGVVKLFQTVYGKDYPVKTFIDPELLTRENLAGRTISTVVRTSSGDIVGHNALFNSAPWEGIKESGSGLVHPLYRGGRGIFTKMVAHSHEVAARKFGVKAAFGEPVCNHLFAQRMARTLNFRAMALEVDLMPGETYAKEASSSGRVSVMLTIKTVEPHPQAVYMPERYQEALRFMYQDMDDSRELFVSSEASPDQGTSISTQVYGFARVARLTVNQAGRGFAASLAAEEKAALDQGVEVIQVWLNLAWPFVGGLAEDLRGQGYFLGGVLPRWFDTDGLLMQKTVARPNWDSIRMEFERSIKIREFVQADWAEL